MRPPQDFELESLMHPDAGDDDDDGADAYADGPDAPLAMASASSTSSPSLPSSPLFRSQDQSQGSFRRPKWLASSSTGTSSAGRPWYLLLLAPALRLLRPRLTTRYIVLTLFSSLILIRLISSRHLLASPLPGYTGPYGVGALDVEIPLPGGGILINETAVLKTTGRPAFEAETVLATLYYPTSKSFRSTRSRYNWLPKPIGLTAQGYARFARADNFVLRPIFTFALWAIGGGITIPAEVDAPLLPVEDAARKTFPLMVFSHGFASSRTDYTHYLGELASRGHVIAALEHRDGSGPGSMVTYPRSSNTPDRKVLPIRESDLTLPMDTPAFKRHQLAIRDAEIQAAIDMFAALNEDPAPISSANTRSPEDNPYSTLSTWQGRLNLDLLTIAGHSYGATGALQALSTTHLRTSPSASSSKADADADADADTDDKTPRAHAGIILDPGKSSGRLNNATTQPLLIIHSNSWSRTHSLFYGRPHFDTVRDLTRASNAAAWFLTSIGTSHPSVTDAPLLEPLLLSWTTGASLDVKEALGEYVRASVEFLNYVNDEDKGVNGDDRQLLKEPPTHEEYGKWVSKEREEEFPKDLARLWEIHVSPQEK